MIIRIVKLTFKPEHVSEFIEIEKSVHEHIMERTCCKKLNLLRDMNNPAVFFTYSYWESEIALNDYRNSELFRNTWGKVKKLFAEKSEAWSTEIIL